LGKSMMPHSGKLAAFRKVLAPVTHAAAASE
jgi:hypothetical protein